MSPQKRTLIERIRDYKERYKRAKAFSVPFTLARNFTLPESIKINGRHVGLTLQNDRATVADFVGIYLNDDYFLQQVPNCDIIIDIGANQGLFVVYARACFPGAMIHAYEPNPRALRYLMDNIADIDVTIFPEAVGKSEELADIIQADYLSHVKINRNECGGVQVISLKKVLDRVPDGEILLKLDCEGFEWEILDSVLLSNRVTFLTMEYHDWARPSPGGSIHNLLSKIGFDVVKHVRTSTTGQILAVNRNKKNYRASNRTI